MERRRSQILTVQSQFAQMTGSSEVSFRVQLENNCQFYDPLSRKIGFAGNHTCVVEKCCYWDQHLCGSLRENEVRADAKKIDVQVLDTALSHRCGHVFLICTGDTSSQTENVHLSAGI